MRRPKLPRRSGLVLSCVLVAAALLAAGFALVRLRTDSSGPAGGPAAGCEEVLYWYDPMAPNQRFDKPGKSPFMDMQLVPKCAGEAEGQGVRIDPALTQNLGARLATVRRGTLEQSIDATGVVEFNERDVAVVQARSAGYVERTYRRAPGDVVRAGAPLADLYVPEWAAAQTEFLALKGTGEPSLVEAGRQRLRLVGMPAALIRQVERSGRPRPVTTVTTPIGGVIQTLSVRPGMTLAEGETLAEVNGLSTVWINAAVPEAQAGMVRVGQGASAELAAFPGETFSGRVTAVLPEAQAESRTLEVRVELPNRGGRLRPGMFATVRLFSADQRTALLVPSEAVIRTGRRNLVMLALPNGRFQPAEVQVGREANGQIEILKGLREGERVVASGQFLIESEASLAGVEARSLEQGAAPAPVKPAGPLHEGRGRIESLSAVSVTLSHGPVASLGWPAMTMGFKLASPQIARGLAVGDQVTFAFEQGSNGPVMRRMTKTGTPG